jgi:hypothetical protein
MAKETQSIAWRPGYMVVECLTQRAAAPWQPDHATWIGVEATARAAILKASATSWLALHRERNGKR